MEGCHGWMLKILVNLICKVLQSCTFVCFCALFEFFFWQDSVSKTIEAKASHMIDNKRLACKFSLGVNINVPLKKHAVL